MKYNSIYDFMISKGLGFAVVMTRVQMMVFYSHCALVYVLLCEDMCNGAGTIGV
jgi:hypothetical protein